MSIEIKRTTYHTYQVYEPMGGRVHYETTNKIKAQGVLEYLKYYGDKKND